MRVAIIGASGEMGSFFARYFLERGASVRGSDIAKAGRGGAKRRKLPGGGNRLELVGTNKAAVKGCEVTILAVPMGSTMRVAKEIAGTLRRGSTLVEISSVKGETPSAIRKALGERARLLSIHPLFGPALQTTEGMKIAVVVGKGKGREASDLSLARELFPRARLVPMGRKEHDRSMAVILSLTHLLNLVYAGTVAQFITPEDFMEVSTPNSSMQLTLAEAILAQDPKLSFAIQTSNAYSRKVARAAALEMKKILGMIKDADWEAFNELFSGLSKRYQIDRRAGAVIREIYSAAEKKKTKA